VQEAQWPIWVWLHSRSEGVWLQVTLRGNVAQIIDEESKKKVEEDGKVLKFSIRLGRKVVRIVELFTASELCGNQHAALSHRMDYL
jgi:hypothetical protein